MDADEDPEKERRVEELIDLVMSRLGRHGPLTPGRLARMIGGMVIQTDEELEEIGLTLSDDDRMMLIAWVTVLEGRDRP
jgi:hypothetical protein